MEYILTGRSPVKVLKYFEEISAIPRGSGNEAGIADYLVRFAEARSLEVMRDGANNVMIRKSGKGSKKDAPYVMLQGHTDMVCENNEGTNHDFMTDGIKLILDGDTVTADGTTLGGDDGIAVAVMLALLDGDADVTPPLECLFTTSEEVGLDGMQAFDCSQVKSRLLINIDSEDEGTATVACAGGVRTDFDLGLSYEDNDAEACEVHVSGLAGGHSGADINAFRANANKVAAMLAGAAKGDESFRLVSISGGSKDNAIPRECSFTFTSCDMKKAKEAIAAEAEKIRKTLAPCDSGFTLKLTDRTVKKAMTRASSLSVLALIDALPYGVISMCREIPDLVETSSNLGVIRTDGSHFLATSSSRSSVDSKLDGVISRLESIAYLAGAKASHRARYPGWDASGGSPLQSIYAETYERLTGKKPKILGIHAGLECGIVKGRIPDMDIISIGPDMHAIHSPDESFSIPSLDRTYSLIKEMLKTIAER